jgi:hypothetical protein
MRCDVLCFRVNGTVTVSCAIVVAAGSLEEALEIAGDRDQVALCPTGDPEREGIDPEESWVITEADGTPRPTHGEQIIDA